MRTRARSASRPIPSALPVHERTGLVTLDARPQVRANVFRDPFEEVVGLVAEVLQNDFLDAGVGEFTQVVDELLGGADPRA